jgi:hypothetical protein
MSLYQYPYIKMESKEHYAKLYELFNRKRMMFQVSAIKENDTLMHKHIAEIAYGGVLAKFRAF